MEKGFLKNNKFQILRKSGRAPPTPSVFLFLGHMLFNGKGIFNKQQILNFADIYIFYKYIYI